MGSSNPQRATVTARLKAALPSPAKTGLRTVYLTPEYLRTYGLVGGLSNMGRIVLTRNGLVNVPVPGMARTVALRADSSDIAAFGQVILRKSYDIPFGMDPKYIIDGGANVGLASIYFASVFPDARIVAVEPDAGNFNMLAINTGDLPNVERLQGALWSRHTTLTIRNPEEESWKLQVEEQTADGIELPAYTIDDLLARSPHGRIDILKLDIEGAEKAIFENCASWLPYVDMIIVELHDRWTPGCSEAFYRAVDGFSVLGQWGENIVVRNRNLAAVAS